MTESTSPTDVEGPSRQRTHARHGTDRHRSAVVSSEMRRLERRLREFGPMPKSRLAEQCGAERWREGTFEDAVRDGIRAGRLKQLPLGWIEAVPDGDLPPAAA